MPRACGSGTLAAEGGGRREGTAVFVQEWPSCCGFSPMLTMLRVQSPSSCPPQRALCTRPTERASTRAPAVPCHSCALSALPRSGLLRCGVSYRRAARHSLTDVGTLMKRRNAGCWIGPRSTRCLPDCSALQFQNSTRPDIEHHQFNGDYCAWRIVYDANSCGYHGVAESAISTQAHTSKRVERCPR